MKKLTLKEAWEKCLDMWGWIAMNYEEGRAILSMKIEYLSEKEDGD